MTKTTKVSEEVVVREEIDWADVLAVWMMAHGWYPTASSPFGHAVRKLLEAISESPYARCAHDVLADALRKVDALASPEENPGALRILSLVEERDEARGKYQWMVEHAADQKLDGYRELGARAAKAEEERDAARAGECATPSESYSIHTDCGDEYGERCRVCGDEVDDDPHTWVECSRKLADHRDHLLGFAATLEHERDAARRRVQLLMRLLERSRSSKADLRTLLEAARAERNEAEDELRALAWLVEWCDDEDGIVRRAGAALSALKRVGPPGEQWTEEKARAGSYSCLARALGWDGQQQVCSEVAVPEAPSVTKPRREHMGVEVSAAELRILLSAFGVGGVCACDGALDYGCPLCTKEQFVEWLREVRGVTVDDLHVFGDDCEWVVAASLEDAKAVLTEMGATLDDDFDETWAQEDDEMGHTIWCDSGGHPAEPHAAGNAPVTLTCAEWAKRCGRGYLCTTEY